MNKTSVNVEQFKDVEIDWAKDVFAPGPDGSVVQINTIIRINSTLTALDPLTDKQLDKLERVVTEAIANERSRRHNNSESS